MTSCFRTLYIVHRSPGTHGSLYTVRPFRTCRNYYQSSDWRGRPVITGVWLYCWLLELEPVQFPVLDRAGPRLDRTGLRCFFLTGAGPSAAFLTDYVHGVEP